MLARHTVCTVCFLEMPSYKWNSGRPIAIQTVQWDWKRFQTGPQQPITSILRKNVDSIVLILIFRSLISPFPANSCAYRNLSSTCFVLLLVPNRVAMLFPAAQSVWMLMLIDFASFCCLMYSASLMPCAMAYSSAPPELCAIVPCVLLRKQTMDFKSRTKVPLRLLQVLRILPDVGST